MLYSVLPFLAAPAGDDFLASYGLPAIFLVMLLKEAGVPIPVPADLIMLGAAARAAAGQFDLVGVIVTFEVAMVAGGLIQYALARGPGRGVVYRFGRFVGLTRPRLDRAGQALQRGGIVGLGLALTTPGVRAASVAAAGLANLPLRTFVPGLIAGNTVFFLLHIVIGYAGSQGLDRLLQATNLPAGPALASLGVLLLVLGFLGWLFIRGRGHARGTGAPLPEVVGAWEEACCPACLALAAVRQVRGAVPLAVEG